MFNQTNPIQHGAVVHNCHRAFRHYSKRKNTFDGIYPNKPATVESETIQRGDPCFYSELPEDQRTRFGDGVPIFSSFNGVQAADRNELKEQLYFCGVATTDLPFNERTSTNDALSTQVGGTCTMMNTWNQSLKPGDTVILSPPKEPVDGKFVDCARLPPSMGPKQELKIRPITKRFNFKIGGRVRKNLESLQDLSSPTTSNNIDLAHSHTVSDAIQNPRCASWLAVKAVTSVSYSLQPFIIKLVTDEVKQKFPAVGAMAVEDQMEQVTAAVNNFMDLKGVILANTDFVPNAQKTLCLVRLGQFCAFMTGMPWLDDELLTFRRAVGGVTADVNFVGVREKTMAELKKRLLTGSSTTDDTPYGNTLSRDVRFNPYMVKSAVERKRTHGTASKSWENTYMPAIQVAQSYTELVAKDCESSLRKKSKRVVGVVLKGGESGAAMDILLRGTKIAGMY